METEDRRSEELLTSEVGGNIEQKLLRELIRSCEHFVTKNELRGLSESLKRIFYHGLSLDKHVSEVTKLRDIRRSDESQLHRSKPLISCVVCLSENSLLLSSSALLA